MISSKAVGEDEVSITLIKMLFAFIIPHLTYLVNQSFTKSYFSANWKKANIKPIPKISNPQLTEHYRQISILSVMSKVLERSMKMQLDDYLNSQNLLHPAQNGFRRRRSTYTALLSITNEISEAFDKNKAAILCLLDFEKAFE